MILFDKGSEVYEVRGQLKINVLAVSNNILSLCQIVLTFFGKHNIKHTHSLFCATCRSPNPCSAQPEKRGR